MNSASRHSGFTLIELIIFIVVVSAGLAGILSVMNTSVKSSADPMVRKQAIAIAESVLEEVLQKAYADPDGTNTGETGRTNWDNVDDYNGKTQADLALPAALSAYAVTIAVSDGSAALGIAARKVTVTVSRGPESITLTGYRTNY
ncbi:type IV pilus modification PilV family protein [Rhodoferax mekongensis]|uniref:Type II secretion system protein n=1 Tax=Rhodoferax mekongensis TaxID=3068341 RepID=A0ABZ0AZX9_9BURK|nr:type II secretion system protein [Rhodoferax sp. TBRC 17307]NBX20052.1 type II secretion system protein [Betaproteobacteria bacterium]WNO05218.1 type II secretion system protein [Rhodoferax sp. TBRC 17307]